MKRILISLTYYYPNISGVSVYAQLLAKEMARKNYQITILTAQHEPSLKEKEEDEGVEIVRVPVEKKIGKGVIMLGFIKKAWNEVDKNEIVNCHLPQLESYIVAIIAKLKGKKLIVTHHCEFGFDGPVGNRIIATLSFPFHFVAYALADTIVAYTKDYAEHSIFLRIFKEKIGYILPPVVVEETSAKVSIKKNKDEKIIGYVGRIGWEKGINYLLDALPSIQQQLKVKLVLVGPYKNVVGDKSFEKLKPLIEANKKSVILTGPVAHSQLRPYYQLFDCLVLPSTNNLETFGIVQAEAMICGCPVVASDLPGVRVPVRLTGMGAIAKVGNSEDLAAKIIKVLDTTYSQDQIDRAVELFDFSRFGKSYEQLFNE